MEPVQHIPVIRVGIHLELSGNALAEDKEQAGQERGACLAGRCCHRGKILGKQKARRRSPTGLLCSTVDQPLSALLASSMSLMPPTLLSTPVAS